MRTDPNASLGLTKARLLWARMRWSRLVLSRPRMPDSEVCCCFAQGGTIHTREGGIDVLPRRPSVATVPAQSYAACHVGLRHTRATADSQRVSADLQPLVTSVNEVNCADRAYDCHFDSAAIVLSGFNMGMLIAFLLAWAISIALARASCTCILLLIRTLTPSLRVMSSAMMKE